MPDIETGCSGYAESAPPDPCVKVIFGASGDLTRRELAPALFQLARLGLLPEQAAIIGFARRPWNDEAFRNEMLGALEKIGPLDRNLWDSFARRITYVQGNFDDPPSESYARLADHIQQVRRVMGIPDNTLFHLATPPEYYPAIIDRLKAVGLTRSEQGWRRVVVEKPFGVDRASARELNRLLLEGFKEEQIYRIDHFLGKETVQNMLVFRFANPSFEPIWNRNFIDSVQISVGEDIGIGTRADFYESTGIVRDMVQNHLLQLLCMVTTEPPARFDSESLRNGTYEALKAVRCLDVARDVVLGQYGPGSAAGASVPGYRQEKGVEPDSKTPTFAALRLFVDNWRWAGVPFYLRTGKRLRRKLAEVTIAFRPTPHVMFSAPEETPREPNILTFRLQPEEGIILRFFAKQPGPEICIRPVKMRLLYAEAFGIESPPSAYEWLLLDVMKGEQTLFARADWIEKAWSIVDPVIRYWERRPPADFPNYAAGSGGPAAADQLLEQDGRRWMSP